MKGVLVRWVVSALALYATAWLSRLVGLDITVTGAGVALLAVAVLAIINALIRPLIVMLTLPLNCLTLGLVTFLINTFMFWLAGSGVVPGFAVNGFWAALFGSVVMGVINGLASHLIGSRE